MEVCLTGRDERRKAGGLFVRGTPERPVRGLLLFGLCNYARDRGKEVTFVVEGPNAREAAGRVRRLLDKPLDVEQIRSKTILWASGLAKDNAPKGGYEREELRATVPGENGLECTFYQYIARRTAHLRDRLYVTVVAEGEEFRPSYFWEHFPNAELLAYQTEAGRLHGTGERAFGKGRRLKATFVCYSPPGSGGAEEAVSEIRAALEKLQEVAEWPDGKRSMFGARHGFGLVADGKASTAPYRPPEGVLAHRPSAPVPGPRRGNVPRVRSFAELVDERLRKMGERGALLADERARLRAEREQERALRRRGYLTQKETEALMRGASSEATGAGREKRWA